MTWVGDPCMLVDAFRAGTLSPTEVVQEVLDAADPCHAMRLWAPVWSHEV